MLSQAVDFGSWGRVGDFRARKGPWHLKTNQNLIATGLNGSLLCTPEVNPGAEKLVQGGSCLPQTAEPGFAGALSALLFGEHREGRQLRPLLINQGILLGLLGQPRETATESPSGSEGQTVLSIQRTCYSSDKQSVWDPKIWKLLVGPCSLQFRG